MAEDGEANHDAPAKAASGHPRGAVSRRQARDKAAQPDALKASVRTTPIGRAKAPRRVVAGAPDVSPGSDAPAASAAVPSAIVATPQLALPPSIVQPAPAAPATASIATASHREDKTMTTTPNYAQVGSPGTELEFAL